MGSNKGTEDFNDDQENGGVSKNDNDERSQHGSMDVDKDTCVNNATRSTTGHEFLTTQVHLDDVEPSWVSQSPHLSSSTQPSSSSTSQQVGDSEETECPICYDSINPENAVMRCSSSPCHYFHQTCLRQWIDQCRQRSGATCPVCRQGLMIHSGRLRDFLAGAESESLTADERGFLERLSDSIPGKSDWIELCTLENVIHYGSLAASAGFGFWNGYNNNFFYSLPSEFLPRGAQTANFAGYAIGAAARFLMDRHRCNGNGRRSQRNRDC